MNFLASLKSGVAGWYYEIPSQYSGDSEHKIYPQSQYLLYITFKRLNRLDLARQISEANLFGVPAVDREGYSNDRFCVLDNDAPPFYLANWNQPQLPVNYDEIALIGHYRAITDNLQGAKDCATLLKSKWNSTFNVLDMDEGDKTANNGSGLFRVYKTALAGTLYARVGSKTDCITTATILQSMQDPQTKGWITDLDANGKPNGKPNIETTCLCLICLHCAQLGGTGFSVSFP